MKKYTQGIDLPVGFGLALEEFQAMNYFFPCLKKNSSIWLTMRKRSSLNRKCWLMFNQL